jgi:lysophospholipase L1-like esterase
MRRFLPLLAALTLIAPAQAASVAASVETSPAGGGLELHLAAAVDRQTVVLHFDRAISARSARKEENYSIPGLEILDARREGPIAWSSATRAILTVSPMADTLYQVTVTGVRGQFGAPIDPGVDSWELRGFDGGTTRYHKMRMMGDSVGWGLWPILTDPGYTLYNLVVHGLRSRQEGSGIELHSRNLSVPGYTSEDLIEKTLDGVVAAQPDVVIVEIGGNDFGGLSYSHFEQNLRFIYDVLKSEVPQAQIIGTDIYTAVLNAYPDGGDGHSVEEWVELIRTIGADYEVPIVDVYHPFYNYPEPGGWFLSFDGLHPNSAGHSLAAAAGYELVRRLPHRPATPRVVASGNHWVDVVSNVWEGDRWTEYFRFELDGEVIAELPTDALPFRIAGLDPDIQYDLRVQAIVPESGSEPRIASGWSELLHFYVEIPPAEE